MPNNSDLSILPARMLEKDQKQSYHNQNESISKTNLFDGNFMQIGL